MLESTDHRPRDDLRGRTGVSGAARGLLATVGTTALLLVGATNYSATTNTHCKRPALRVACTGNYTVRMLSGWVAATRHSPRNVAHAH
jgi:hypothetical protein